MGEGSDFLAADAPPSYIRNSMVTDIPPPTAPAGPAGSLDPVLAALGDPVRREIVQHLAIDGPLAVRPLAERFPISRPAVSRHLRILTEAGVLARRPVGRENHYRVEPAALQAVERWLHSLWSGRLQALKTLVEEEAP